MAVSRMFREPLLVILLQLVLICSAQVREAPSLFAPHRHLEEGQQNVLSQRCVHMDRLSLENLTCLYDVLSYSASVSVYFCFDVWLI